MWSLQLITVGYRASYKRFGQKNSLAQLLLTETARANKSKRKLMVETTSNNLLYDEIQLFNSSNGRSKITTAPIWELLPDAPKLHEATYCIVVIGWGGDGDAIVWDLNPADK